MMINVVLYDESSTIRIARKAKNYLSGLEFFRTTSDTIWINGLYFRFSPQLITVNAFHSNKFTKHQISDCLRHILEGEEVFISSDCHEDSYIEKVDCTTNFDNFFALKGV